MSQIFNTSIDVKGNILSGGIISKVGGTSSQFLKANGSVDATVYAPINSPTFTGTPTAPTATAGTNTTQIATTAFVNAGLATKQNTLTNPITGTGATNFLPKFNGTSSQTASRFFDDGTTASIASSFTLATDLKSSTNNMILSDTGGTIFRGVRANSWTDAVSTRFFQVGNTSDNVAFTLQSGNIMSRLLFSSAKTQFSPSGYLSTPPPVGIFEVLDGANNVALSVSTSGQTVINKVPTTSASTYDFLTRNTSNGVVEKVLSNTIATVTSPSFTGTPTAPTATVGTNTTQIATTAFVQAVDANVVHKTGEETIGLGEKYFTDNVNFTSIAVSGQATGVAAVSPNEFVIKSQLDLKAPLSSPTFTGTPTAPTATAGTNTTQIATTAFVTTADNLKANIASPTFTGTVGGITATMVGLGNVNNTSDASKPVSTAQQTALNLKENSFAKNTAFNKNFGTTAGTVAEGDKFLPINANAVSATSLNLVSSSGTNLNTAEMGRHANYSNPWGLSTGAPNASYGTVYNFGGIDKSVLSLQLLADVNHNVTNSTKDFYFRTGNNLGFQDDWKKLWHDGNFNPANYLPLTGGVVTGSVTATSYTGSATLTGTPTAPTATVGTSTTQIATTAFVMANGSSSSATFTPTAVSGITFSRCYWIKNGNVLDVVYNFSITGNTSYSATMTLPNSFTINANSNGREIGGGKITTNSGYSRVQETATSSDIFLSIVSENTGAASGFARASVLIN